MRNHSCVLKRTQNILLLKEAAISKNWNMFFKFLLSRTERQKWQKIDERTKLFFCHFRDLYTGWHHGQNKDSDFMELTRSLSSINPTFLVEDKRVIDKAIETEVVTELEISQG